MADIGMGSNMPNQLNHLNKLKETEKTDKVDKRDNVRESMAGAKQVEEKHKKEDVPKTEDRFRAYQKAARYMLGEDPDDDIDDELDFAAVAETEETEAAEEPQKPTLEEFEEYDVRNRFKAKIFFHLGDNFNEEAPPEEEEELTPEERDEDTFNRLVLARNAFSSLNQYITDSLGTFSFDRIADLRLFISNGMPEDAMIKLIILHQMSRSDHFFPDYLDISVITGKLLLLDIPKSEEEIREFISNDFGTFQRFRYTVSGFIYMPLQEIINIIAEEMNSRYLDEFKRILKKYGLDDFPDLTARLPRELMVSCKELVLGKNRQLHELIREYVYERKKILNTVKPTVQALQKIKEHEVIMHHQVKVLANMEQEITRLIFIYSYLNSRQSIADFNKNYPLDLILYTLGLLKIRTDRNEIRDFLYRKVTIYTLDEPVIPPLPDEKNTTAEIYDLRTRAAISGIKSQPAPKQQQMIKSTRNGTIDQSSLFYWLKQKNFEEIKTILGL